MKIIIIGMDNTGKTTLSHDLQRSFGFPIYKNHKGENTTYKEWFKSIPHYSAILERFYPIEEYVYGYILRGTYADFNSIINAIDAIKQHEKLLIIYTRPSYKVIKDWKGREQKEGVIANCSKLTNKFDKLISSLNRYYYIYKYDYTKNEYKQLVKYIEDFFKIKEQF